MKLIRHLANLGYGSRKDVQKLLRMGVFTDAEGNRLTDNSDVAHEQLLYKGKPLDPAQGMVLMLHKPTGYVCSTKDRGQLVYELLPPRFSERKPALSSVGRLDADTSGLLLFTDDGQYLHKIISPKNHVPKVYEVTLARPIEGHEATIFASGALLLESETTPLKPAEMTQTGEKTARLTLHEGRYHQVRRMFAAVGNHVEALHRSHVGHLGLGTLKAGQWRLLAAAEAEGLLVNG
ncbi:pseudouridine synthase [Asticcacaulis tiandongensis]|uniref:pseudouridine synthase n=1 Tax=Asticcacaulis tiandongensis TaxID=2565365 RepID=UPI001127EB68|nr:16S rRNA pseudouridine(516) synthase [Asticcacaulis tiandongensis]